MAKIGRPKITEKKICVNWRPKDLRMINRVAGEYGLRFSDAIRMILNVLGDARVFTCPNCGVLLVQDVRYEYCPRCGRRLGERELEEATSTVQ